MDKFLLGTNWKMHKTEVEARDYTEKLVKLASDYDNFQFFIIPPYTDLRGVKETLAGASVWMGAQNMHWLSEGPYTGEISPEMLDEIGIDLIELGHSERRQYYNETDYSVNLKAKAANSHGFIALVCVGENIHEKEMDATKETLAKQLKIGLHEVFCEQLIVAYEPVWAIGENGIPAEPSYAGYVHTFIRDYLIELYGDKGKEIPILYGGSVNPDNAVELSNQPNVDGLFIGRSAWDIVKFRSIAKQITEK